MKSDIKLDGDWVILEGNWTRVRTWDFMLDAPDRRQTNSGWRRALVHDSTDGLTINYNGDYPGGVKIKGKVNVESLEGQNVSSQILKTNFLETGSARVGQYTFASSSSQGLHIGDSVTNTYIKGQHVRVDNNLTVDGDANFTEEVKVHDIVVSPKMTPENEMEPQYQPYSLFERIKEMQQTINELRERIENLENR